MNGTSFVFVPVINVDGFKYVSDYYEKNKQWLMVRKNRNDGAKDGYKACVDDLYKGVDLNRNYPYKYGYSILGSSND